MRLRYILTSVIIILCISCNTSNSTLPDVSKVKVTVQLTRFDQDFFAPTTSLATHIDSLYANYGRLLDYYLLKTSNAAAPNSSVAQLVQSTLQQYTPLYDSVQLQYQNLGWLHKDLTKAFQYYTYHYPKFITPKIITIVDGYYPDEPQSYYGVEANKDTVLVSLQMFLGSTFSYYDPQVYYDYLRVKFTKDYILKNIITALINDQYQPIDAGSTLLATMIDAGKRTYLLSQIIPSTPEHIILGYTKAQLADCNKNEMNVWSHFVQANELYTVEPSIIKEYIGENPFTKVFGTDSPGNIGNYVGYKIITKYMSKNSSVPLATLMTTDPTVIYQQAKYKPE